MRSIEKNRAGLGTKAALCAWASLAPMLMATELARLEVREHLGLTYAPQTVHDTAEIARGALQETTRCTLKDGGGKPVLAQIKALDAWDDGSVRHVRVSFIVGLTPFESHAFVLDDSGQKPQDDGALKLTARKDVLVIESPLAGVEIPSLSKSFTPAEKQPETFPPPIARIRGRHGWIGKARISLDSSFRLKERTVTIADDGPIFKRVMVSSVYAKGSDSNTFGGNACLHAVEITLCRGEELIRVKESFSFPFTDLSPLEFAFDFYPGLQPDTTVCRPLYSSQGPYGGVGSLWDLAPYEGPMFPLHYDRDDTVGFLTPWACSPHNWEHFACYRETDGADADMAGILLTAPERWDHIAYISPEDSWKLVQNPHTFFTLKKIKDVLVTSGADRSLVAHFPLTTGTREWAFFAGGPFPRTSSREVKTGNNVTTKTSQAAPREYFKSKVNHYAFLPLDQVKEWVLEWPADTNMAFPHLYYTRAEFDARREKFNAWQGDKTVPPLDDPVTLSKLKETLLQRTDEAVRRMAVNPGPPHHIASDIYPAANLSDLLLGTEALTHEERTRLRAQLAYMAYIMNGRGYWAPELGYAANPNMSSFCYDAVGLIGLLLRDHPESETWIRACTTQIDREVAHWISDDGAQIESLHYMRAAWQEHTMLITALKQAGIRDYFRNPRVQRFFEYYFNVQTPPHPENNFQRGTECIGNAYGRETIDEFNAWARGLADVDTALSGAMQWMWKEHGYGNAAEMTGKRFPAFGAGFALWFLENSGLPPYSQIALFDPFITPVAPTGPEFLLGGRYKGFGAVFNSHFGGRKETKLLLRQGSFYSHWDADQGSIVLWGKGAPLVMDHGYGEFHPWFHNRINVNHMYNDDLGEVTACFAGDGGAFVQGDITLSRLSLREHAWITNWPFTPEPINGRAMQTDWRRRIVMMKDADPDGPNYIVMRDTVAGELPTEWVLWAYGAITDFQATPIRAKGAFGVDLLVYLLDEDKGKVSTGKIAFPEKLAIPFAMLREMRVRLTEHLLALADHHKG